MQDEAYQTTDFIGGHWLEGDGEPREIIDPATGEAFVAVRDATIEQAHSAVVAAKRAGARWAGRTTVERAAVMRRVADLVRRDAETLASLVVREQGKPISEARGEVAGAAGFFDYFAEFARRIRGDILPSDVPGEQICIQRVPVGIVAGIIPWNYPAALVSRKVAPAMIAGDTIVIKPHEMTPLSALHMATLLEEAGVPSGVVNVVTGDGPSVGAALASCDDVALISMTGSVRAGKQIMRSAADNLTQPSLELGGKAPFIVLENADLEFAVRSAVTSRFMNCGQVCICNERTLVAQPIFDEFLERYVELTRTLRVGHPMQETTDIGPKVSLPELKKVEAPVDGAIERGARPALRGGRPDEPPTVGGYWMTPTVLVDVPQVDQIMQSEVFGPVVPVVPFADFDEAVTVANSSRYGLSAYDFTNDFTKEMDTVTDIDFGEVYVNRIGPESFQGFHTGYRQSGIGGDDGEFGLDAYLRNMSVYDNYARHPVGAQMPYGKAAAE
ncbi:MAG: aldehyde dehydrogenase family protein [Rhodobacteraceae bacterium]|nr:aldehyde dehydrogenase family protein [Paracoccaceae bacterium]